MSIHTGSKATLSLALVWCLLSACSDAEVSSKQSSNTLTGLKDSKADADPDASTQDPRPNDAGALDASDDAAWPGESRPQPSAAGKPRRGDAQAVRSQPWRVVPLGDSITEITCTSQLLWQKLRDAGAKNFDLVGSTHSKLECGVDDADRDNEGHSGYRATDLIDDGQHASEFSAWRNADKADVVLMHLGTNDIAQANLPPETILNAYSKILKGLRDAQPKVIVFVAQIIPMNPSNCDYCSAQVPKLNALIPEWAGRESQPDSPVNVVDQFAGFDLATDTDDDVHPNKHGAQKMADKWSAALLEQLDL